MSARSVARQEKRAEAKLRRQEQAQRQADAIKHRITEYENKHEVDERPSAIRSGNRVLTLVLFLALTLSLLTALTLGVVVFRNLTVRHTEQNTLRTETSIIASSIHLLDAQDAVSTREGLEGQALILTEDVDGQKFETRYYLYEGNIMQEYFAAATPFNPSAASVVCASSTFEVEVSGSIVTFTTDAGTSRVSLRSLQGGES